MLHECIAKLMDGSHLSREEASAALHTIMDGQATPALTAGFLVALRARGETADEITGLAETMRRFATRIPVQRSPLVDTCGTGGDHSGSFNISTTTAFVVAGAGLAVAKHGNRSASSRCGSADVLEALGVGIDASPETVGRCIDQAGIGFLFARQFHTAMRHVAPVRQELKIRTVFNILGPLTNPAGACSQVVGVFDRELVRTLAQVLGNLGSRRALVVAGNDGLDEISLSGLTQVAELKDGSVRHYTIGPDTFGIGAATREALRGGDAAENAIILRSVLEGAPGPMRDVVLANAAAGLMVGDVVSEWKEGVQKARESIDSGAALAKLEELVRLSHDT
jgi:anthranilate phosphoribosyltransferase